MMLVVMTTMMIIIVIVMTIMTIVVMTILMIVVITTMMIVMMILIGICKSDGNIWRAIAGSGVEFTERYGIDEGIHGHADTGIAW